MPRLSVRNPHVTPEDISALVGSDTAAADGAKAEALHDWYPIDLDLSGQHTAAICQRANAAYAERLLHPNANIWLGLTVSWSVAAVVLSLAFGLELSAFILGVFLPLLPALLDMYEQWRATKQAGAHRRAIADAIEELIRGTDGIELTDDHLLVWQDQLYNVRRSAPQVPNIVYRKTRDKNERAMNAAAAELATVAKACADGGQS